MIAMELQLPFQSHGILENQIIAMVEKIVSCIGDQIRLDKWAIYHTLLLGPQFVSQLYKTLLKVIGNAFLFEILMDPVPVDLRVSRISAI